MPAISDRIFVAIAVSKPGGGLAPLPGAITAAERMAAWAEEQGYNTLLLHDGTRSEITVEFLRDEITTAINEVTDHTELKRLIIYFAGHGAALAFGDQYWILTNWKQDKNQAIKVYDLQRMLEFYGPRQVALIGDACQEFSSKFSSLVGSPVLFEPDEDPRPYELDQFFAVDAGMQAFMIKAQGEQKDFCLFTEVLLDALEGDAQGDYFESDGAGRRVTSQSLAVHLQNTVTLEASKYGVRMIPRPRPGFFTDRTYLHFLGEDYGGGLSPPTSPDNPGGGLLGGIMGGAQENSGNPSLGYYLRKSSKTSLIKPKGKQPRLVAQVRALQQTREARRAAFVAQVARANEKGPFRTGCFLCVSGAQVISVQTAKGDVAAVEGQPNWFRIQLPEGMPGSLGWSDVLVSLDDGRIVPVCVIDGFVAALHIVDGDSLSLFHRPLEANVYEGQTAIDLLAQAHAGMLSPESIINSAAELRNSKHLILTLGCIAAQLYDGLRDLDSLRSMAAFYALHQQPVPLDIILYGGGTISEVDGQLFADIPAVAERQPRTGQEDKHSFTHVATPAFPHHPIAGRIPWMHQAWSAVVTVRCAPNAVSWRDQVLAAREYLAPGLFSVLLPGSQPALMQLAGIKVEETMPEPMLTH